MMLKISDVLQTREETREETKNLEKKLNKKLQMKRCKQRQFPISNVEK